MAGLPLSGIRVLITRPSVRATALAEHIQRVGGEPVLAPCLEIQAIDDNPALQSALLHCGSADKVIFISPSAVDHADGITPLSRLKLHRVFAPGSGTERALRAVGITDVAVPERGHDSEALLALDDLQNVRDEQICIVRGEGGREKLRDKLVSRGADVRYVEVYRREKPAAATNDVTRALGYGVNAVLISSGETLENMICSVGTDALHKTLLSLPLFVPGARVAELARRHGFDRVHVTQSPDDTGIVDSLIEWVRNHAH